MIPSLGELLGLGVAARHLTLHAREARSLLQGSHRSGHRGRGLEFLEVRPYAARDDARSIDWRVTARRGRPHTKLFHEERERAVWLLVDLDSSLFFGTRRQLKSAVAVRAAALLSWVAALGGDRVGAVLAGASTTRVLPPRAREAGALPILAALDELQPRTPAPSSPRALTEVLRTLAPLVRPGSLVLALSDFAVVDEASEVLWSRLAAHSECRLFFISDPLEEHGLPGGRFRVGVPGRTMTLEGTTSRARWLAAWRDRLSRIEGLASRLDMSLVRLDTHADTSEVLQELLHKRRPAA